MQLCRPVPNTVPACENLSGAGIARVSEGSGGNDSDCLVALGSATATYATSRPKSAFASGAKPSKGTTATI